MPRPSLAQTLSGSATVVLTTLALLLITGTQSGTGAVLIACGALLLGLTVAMLVGSSADERRRATASALTQTEAAGGAPAAEVRLPQPSLRR
ncbi:hypothetical protein [Streptomyces alkaliterrae]|uniref:Uncharacterized protein n=1 Tax=Streptomyces alkaliterrae TaxID=2213162 RepID=A0A5P0YXI2_9ACTN|nr:hypothetical protein [Streptomyces alkaliterrae]MBB1256203.1 hypothetical protein [Streptomyces alkaliterrae]MBB1262262.1 hypothetical protein [Streptomyces alkaliterrae]MQS04995.1 hypothetical protein [Streptomyces alkaliterrae]